MSLISFTASTKAKASEVNSNFNYLDLIQKAICKVPSAGDNYTQEDVSITGSDSLTAGKLYRFASLDVSGTLTFTKDTDLEGYPTIIIVDGNCTVSGTVSVNSCGHAAGLYHTGFAGYDAEDNLTYAPYMSSGGGAGFGGSASGGSPGAAATFTQFTNEPDSTTDLFNALLGAGGGGGGSGSDISGSYGRGGSGGVGGGCLILIVLGNFNGTGGTISATGAAGGPGIGGNATYSGGGGGGGGAGGTIVIAYTGTYSAPTLTVTAGSGGAASTGAATGTGGTGGSGGAGQSGTNSTAGSANSGANGGAGGAGSAGQSYAFQITL